MLHRLRHEACCARRILEGLWQTTPSETPLWKLVPQLILEDLWQSILGRPVLTASQPNCSRGTGGTPYTGTLRHRNQMNRKEEPPPDFIIEACAHNASLGTYSRATLTRFHYGSLRAHRAQLILEDSWQNTPRESVGDQLHGQTVPGSGGILASEQASRVLGCPSLAASQASCSGGSSGSFTGKLFRGKQRHS